MAWLILGGNSALAKKIIQNLSSKEHIYTTTRHKKDVNQTSLFLDLANEQSIEDFIPPNTKSHKIAFFGISKPIFAVCETEPEKTYTLNVTNTLILAKKLANLGWKIVYPSTSAVFDGATVLAKIDDKINPKTEYGRQKAFVEQQLLANIPNVLIVRISKIIFSDMQLFIDWAHNLCDSNIIAFSDYIFAPVGATEATKALINLILKDKKGIWHISAAQEILYNEAAQVIANTLDIPLDRVQGVKGKDLHPERYFPKHASLDASLTELEVEMNFESPITLIEKWTKKNICCT